MLRRGSSYNLHNLATWHLKRIVWISRHETWQTVFCAPYHVEKWELFHKADLTAFKQRIPFP